MFRSQMFPPSVMSVAMTKFNYLQDCVVADMCLRLLVLGLHDQATASLIEIVFAIVCCVRVCISLIAQWLSQCTLSCSVWDVFFWPPHAR